MEAYVVYKTHQGARRSRSLDAKGQIFSGRIGDPFAVRSEFGQCPHQYRLFLSEVCWLVENLGLTGTLKVNGASVGEPYPLQHGDEIVCGEACLRFQLAGGGAEEPARNAHVPPPIPQQSSSKNHDTTRAALGTGKAKPAGSLNQAGVPGSSDKDIAERLLAAVDKENRELRAAKDSLSHSLTKSQHEVERLQAQCMQVLTLSQECDELKQKLRNEQEAGWERTAELDRHLRASKSDYEHIAQKLKTALDVEKKLLVRIDALEVLHADELRRARGLAEAVTHVQSIKVAAEEKIKDLEHACALLADQVEGLNTKLQKRQKELAGVLLERDRAVERAKGAENEMNLMEKTLHQYERRIYELSQKAEAPSEYTRKEIEKLESAKLGLESLRRSFVDLQLSLVNAERLFGESVLEPNNSTFTEQLRLSIARAKEQMQGGKTQAERLLAELRTLPS